MNIFIVHAHENELSFCSALKNKAKEFYSSRGNHVVISDLYRMNFNPVAGKNDFKNLSGAEYYKLQAEQVHAYQNNLFAEEIKREMEKLEKADIVIFNFPLWWFSLPAILKGWVDRVFAMGYAYGAGKGVYENGVFPNKKAFLAITTGGPDISYQSQGKNGDIGTILFHINHGILYFTGMRALPPFIVYGPARMSEDERKAKLQDYETYLGKLDSLRPLF